MQPTNPTAPQCVLLQTLRLLSIINIVAFVRHWSWGANDNRVYFSVFTEDEPKAISTVNAMFDNTNGSENLPIELRTIHLQEREKYGLPWCREQTCTRATKNVCMQPCTDLESTKNNWPRLQLGVRPAITQNCRRHGSTGTGHKVRIIWCERSYPYASHSITANSDSLELFFFGNLIRVGVS